jgi:hypothetical protein
MTIVLQDVKHPAHLAKDEYARALFFHTPQKLVEDDHLARIMDQVLVGSVRWTWLCAIEEVRVTSDFTQLESRDSGHRPATEVIQTNLHDDVHQPRLAFLATSQAVDGIDILLQDRTIPLSLHLR